MSRCRPRIDGRQRERLRRVVKRAVADGGGVMLYARNGNWGWCWSANTKRRERRLRKRARDLGDEIEILGIFCGQDEKEILERITEELLEAGLI